MTSARSEYVALAERVGSRVLDAAVWEGSRCSWLVWAPDSAWRPGKSPTRTPAPGTIYLGTAGIGLILGELHALTGQAKWRAGALGAIRHATWGAENKGATRYGFYEGRLGVAYVAARLYELTGEDECLELAGHCARPPPGEADAGGGDVMHGAAGGVMALAGLGLSEDPLLEHLAGSLVDRAVREATGWSWPPRLSVAGRNLTGYAHGASGYAHALMAAYTHTGDDRYRHGAFRAMDYERQFLDLGTGNWLDVRYREITHALFSHRVDEATRLSQAVARSGATPDAWVGWCYGAAGIGLARLRCVEVAPTAAVERDLRAAIRATVAAVKQEGHDQNLCHGRLGNCDFLLEAGRHLSQPELVDQAQAVLDEAIDRYGDGRKPWPMKDPTLQPDPSLFLGEMATAYFALRCASDGVACILAPPVCSDVKASQGAPGRSEVQRDVHTFFGRTMHLLERKMGREELPSHRAHTEPPLEVLNDAAKWLRHRIRVVSPAERGPLVDAYRFERQCARLSETAAFELPRLPQQEGAVDPFDLLRSDPNARAWRTYFDWELLEPFTDGKEHFRVVTVRQGRVVSWESGPLMPALLRAFRKPVSLKVGVEVAAGKLGGPQSAAVTASLLAQVDKALHADLLVRVSGGAEPSQGDPTKEED